jgi:hypothetical protein
MKYTIKKLLIYVVYGFGVKLYNGAKREDCHTGG